MGRTDNPCKRLGAGRYAGAAGAAGSAAKGASITLAAELRGLLQFRTPSHIVGILLNDCSESLYKTLRPMLEVETGLPVVGYLPHLPGCVIESRHLGLKTAGEISDLQQKLGQLADALVLDWAQLAVLTDRPARLRCRLPRRARPPFALPWRGTKPSALPTPKRWTPCGMRVQSLHFSARCGMPPCRKISAGCTCPGLPGAVRPAAE